MIAIMAHTLTDAEAQGLIDLGVRARELPYLAFPDASEDFVDWFLWEKTPFPLVRGVHDIVDAIAETFVRGPRCDEPLKDRNCGFRVSEWGKYCHLHRPPISVKYATGEPGGVA